MTKRSGLSTAAFLAAFIASGAASADPVTISFLTHWPPETVAKLKAATDAYSKAHPDVKIIDAVNHPYLRTLPDFANSVLKGDLDFNYRAMKELFARAYNISHVKDGEADDNGKILNIDIKKTFEIAKAANYRGFYSMEYDAPGDPYAPTKKLIELTLQNIS